MGASRPYPEIWLEPPAGPVMVLAPHPDDETIGCGAVLALHGRRGDAVHVVVVTDGDRGDPEGRYPAGTEYVALRREECRRAAHVLGIAEPTFLGLRDQAIDQRVLDEALGALVARLEPAVLYHPATPEMHPDHHEVGAAALRMARRADPRLRTFAYESWVAVVPTHVIDVSAVWSVKQDALACYASQLAYNDYRRATDGLGAYRSMFLPQAQQVEAFAETTASVRRAWLAAGGGLLRRLRGQ